MFRRSLLICSLVLLIHLPVVSGQTTTPTKPATAPSDPAAVVPPEFVRLRSELNDAYNRRDIDALLKYLHPGVIVIFPDGQLLQGREALRSYFGQMLSGPTPKVKSFTADPVVDGRQMRGDVDLSWGRLNDNYVLNDGTSFGLDSRFTVTLIKTEAGPTETGGWVIRSFHASTDAFDNPVLKMATRTTLTYGLIGGLVGGVIIGLIIGAAVTRTRLNRSRSGDGLSSTR